MKIYFTVLILMLMSGITGCTTSRFIDDTFVLTVKLQSPDNSDFTASTPVTINKPFSTTKPNGEFRNTITGVLKPPVAGIYPLLLSVTEWKSEISSIQETRNVDLKLDKPFTYSSISSVAYMRTLTLSRKKQ